MSILKCKMCGGDLEVLDGVTVCECEYCGTKQTVPTTQDEVIANLYNRANNLRIRSEFDKAQETYEKIVSKNPDEAEAYWGIVLCKYGIEYVEDPDTFKRVPTCHRTQLESVMTDVDYLSAIEHADSIQKDIYEQEAKAIDLLQKDILSIVHKEKPFDVFICYKETDENGKRTVDSVVANDIYHQLTQEGFKVFYAAITLEDKLGQEYEPYIFAALNSAKVMLVVGTKPEHFNAVWVKNEWSRYLKLMKNDRKRTLIPCYRDMDAYDLPEEFSHLQAQDMSKIGFINDVVRGIKKLIVTNEPKKQETVVINQTANANIEPLLKRAFIFLEDKDWDSANEYAEKVLDQEPENAQAYLVKLMAELKISKQNDLRNCEEPFADKANFEKICRYDSVLGEQLKADIAFINERNENTRLENLYKNAIDTARKAYSEEEHKAASKNFDEIIDYKDSKKLKEQCFIDAENARKRSIYQRAISGVSSKDVVRLNQTISLFESIPDYKDSNELLEKAKQRIDEVNKQNEEDRIRREKEAEEQRIREEKAKAELEQLAIEKEKQQKATKRNIIIFVIVVIIALIGFYVGTEIKKSNDYKNATQLLASEQYQEAYDLFCTLNNYKDSLDKSKEAGYSAANKYFENKEYKLSYEMFDRLSDYKDSKDRYNNSKYYYAKQLKDDGDMQNAIKIYSQLGGYKNSNELCFKLRLKTLKEGSVLRIGKYDEKEIEWKVLTINKNKALMFSTDVLFYDDFEGRYDSNTQNNKFTWKNCSLRENLNGDFLNNTFSDYERKTILKTNVQTEYAYDGKDGVENTTDYIFLLSEDEVKKYLSNKSDRITVSDDNYYKDYWLRNTSSYYAHIVYTDEDFYREYMEYSSGVRPAMWISLE